MRLHEAPTIYNEQFTAYISGATSNLSMDLEFAFTICVALHVMGAMVYDRVIPVDFIFTCHTQKYILHTILLKKRARH